MYLVSVRRAGERCERPGAVQEPRGGRAGGRRRGAARGRRRGRSGRAAALGERARGFNTQELTAG